MLVDDSAVIRGLISRILEQDDDIKIVSTVANGKSAVDIVKRVKPDIILLDIEMPVMDGMTALPLLLKEYPEAKIIICSTLSNKNAEVSLKALAIGASECILKPGSGREMVQQHDFKRDIINLVRTLGGLSPRFVPDTKSFPAPLQEKTPPAKPENKEPKVALKAGPLIKNPQVLAIGSSTGGPQALFEVLKNFKDFKIPILITQHMPKTFTKILANHVFQNTGIPCHEGEKNMKVEKGSIYIAPGGYHMTVFKNKQTSEVFLDINEDPPENFCRPSVDHMLRSVIDVYDGKVLTLILTGMGYDGLESCRKVVDAGGSVIAQDKNTSVVWGMPGAVANAGLCSEVLPLDKLGPKIKESVSAY